MSDEIGIVLSEKRYNELKRIESLFKELTKEISDKGKMFIPKDGDVVYNDRKKSTSIFKSQKEYGSTIYAGIDSDGDIFIYERGWSFPTRLANQKETFTFLDALKGKGVRWNAEKKKIEEKKIEKLRWRAKQGEKYWIVQGTGDIEFTTEHGDAADNTFYDYGNYHKTKEMATKARDEVSSLYKSINNSQL